MEEIEELKRLEERWPGLFDMIRVLNGYEEDFSYESLVGLNDIILRDTEGLSTLLRAMMRLMNPVGVSPETKQWLEDNGFIAKAVVDLKKRKEAAHEVLARATCEQEKSDAATELEVIQEKIEQVAQQSDLAMIKSLTGLQIIAGGTYGEAPPPHRYTGGGVIACHLCGNAHEECECQSR